MTTPLWCILGAALLIYFPRTLVMVGQIRQPGGLDNRHPRDQQAKLDGWARRAQAAHLNAFEGFAPFAAAVLVAHVAHADPTWSTYLALAYCALRAIYTLLYVGDLAPARSAVWFAGVAVTVGLFVLPVVKPG